MSEFHKSRVLILEKRVKAAEESASLAVEERALWEERARALAEKNETLKKRLADAAVPPPKKAKETTEATPTAAKPKHCSVCGTLKSECKSTECLRVIAAKKAAKEKQ